MAPEILSVLIMDVVSVFMLVQQQVKDRVRMNETKIENSPIMKRLVGWSEESVNETVLYISFTYTRQMFKSTAF